MSDRTSSPSDASTAGLSRRTVVGRLMAGAGVAAVAGSGVGALPASAATPSAATPEGGLPPFALFSDDVFNFEALLALGSAGYGVSEVGEVVTAVNAINAAGPTFQSFTDTFLALADRVAALSAASSDPITSGQQALRASQYYSQALFFVLGTSDPGRELDIFRASSATWRTFLDSITPAVERIDVQVNGHALPVWFFQPDTPGGTRPTIILTNGSDGQSCDLWAYGAMAALQRGWNAVIYEGPGQGTCLFEQGVPFTDRWETVVTPIVDALIGRPQVDKRRIVLTGLSMGGNLVIRAAAFEHRLAAVVAEPGSVSPWLAFPEGLREIFTADKDETNAVWNELVVPELEQPAHESDRFQAAKRFEPFGREVLDAVRQGKLPTDIWTPAQIIQRLDVSAVAPNVTSPTLVVDYEDEFAYPGQAEEVFKLLTGPKEFVRFTAADGANFHCSPMAPQFHNETIFGWLEQTVL